MSIKTKSFANDKIKELIYEKLDDLFKKLENDSKIKSNEIETESNPKGGLLRREGVKK